MLQRLSITDKGGKDGAISQRKVKGHTPELELQEIAKEADAEMTKEAVTRRTMLVPYTKPQGDPIEVKRNTGKSANVHNPIKPFLLYGFLAVKGKLVEGRVGELRADPSDLSPESWPLLLCTVQNSTKMVS